jgi:glutamate-1-semialdehyde 2,1-aminomutase
LARAVTGRRLLVKFQGCYHGWHDATAANVISDRSRLGTIDATSAGLLPQALDWLVVLPFNDVEALESLMATQGDDVAGVILEPIVHTIGCVMPTPAFLEALRRTTQERGSILIFDEVVIGFRHALGGGYQSLVDIRPDLSTFAKALGNGYPIAAIGGRADLMARFATRPGGDVAFGGTYNGNPIVVAAALATLAALEADEGALHRHLFALGERMRAGLQAIADRLAIPARAQSFGSIFVLYFTDREVRSFEDALENHATRYVAFRRGMIERGFSMPPLNLKRNHLTAAHTTEDVDRTLQAAEDVLTIIDRGATATV